MSALRTAYLGASSGQRQTVRDEIRDQVLEVLDGSFNSMTRRLLGGAVGVSTALGDRELVITVRLR